MFVVLVVGMQPRESGSLGFFLIRPLGIVIEDAVRPTYRDISPSTSPSGDSPSLTERCVGALDRARVSVSHSRQDRVQWWLGGRSACEHHWLRKTTGGMKGWVGLFAPLLALAIELGAIGSL